ncbi:MULTISPECIES: DDE-type integrase/transposase/recombinase [Paenibacillus]|uniref:DDE-type integrase/transposase/recombinase n=1 Tax=Paenibacillus TaxID=44249 RepID=UPI00351B0481
MWSAFLDLYKKKIVGWKLSGHMTTDLVMETLKQAYKAKKMGKNLIHHSDPGSQYILPGTTGNNLRSTT